MATSVNSTTNANSSSSTVKSENGFAIIASLYNNSSDNYINNYQAIVFDSVPSQEIERSAEVTSYAVEATKGTTITDVSDHVQIKNDKLTLTGVITETPIRLKNDLLYAGGLNGTRVSQAMEYLDQILEARQTIVLVTEYRAYEDIVFTGYSYSSTAEYAAQFEMTFERVRLVNSATVAGIATKTKSTSSKGKTVKTAAPSSPKSNLTQQAATLSGTSNNSGTSQ